MALLRRLLRNLSPNLHLVTALASFWLVDALAQRRLRSQGQDARALAGLTIWVGGGALLAGRILYLLPAPSALLRHPSDVVYVNAGVSFYGALAGGALALLAYHRLRHVPFLLSADAYALFAPLGIALFRFTCFLHGPCGGRITSSFLGVRFPGLTVPRYPSELYEGLLALALFAALLHLQFRKPVPGLLLAAFLGGYGVVRGLVAQTRIHASFWAAADPWLALAMTLAGGAMLVWLRSRRGRLLDVGLPEPRIP